MTKIKHSVINYECSCGWISSRVMRMHNPVCSRCGSTTPKITENELVTETELYSYHTPEEYSNITRIISEIIEGKPIEDIEGLRINEDIGRTTEERAQDSRSLCGSVCSSSPWVMHGHGYETTTRDIVKKYNVSIAPSYSEDVEYF
jgi:hypothetical protein